VKACILAITILISSIQTIPLYYTIDESVDDEIGYRFPETIGTCNSCEQDDDYDV
jgi:hypothetical protein